MVQPLRDSRDHYEELKQIDDAMTEVDSPLLHPFKYSIHLVYILVLMCILMMVYALHLKMILY